jgi:urease accessory protein UreE
MAIFAYHLGNRHLPVKTKPDKLLIRCTHVIEAMLIKLGV